MSPEDTCDLPSEAHAATLHSSESAGADLVESMLSREALFALNSLMLAVEDAV